MVTMTHIVELDRLSDDIYLERLYILATDECLTSEQQKKKLIIEILARKYKVRLSDNVLNTILTQYFNKYLKLITFKRLKLDLGLISKIGTLSDLQGFKSVCNFYKAEIAQQRIQSIPKVFFKVVDKKQGKHSEWKYFKYN